MRYKFNTAFESEKIDYTYYEFGKDVIIEYLDDVLNVVKGEYLEERKTITNDEKTIEEQIEYLLNKGIIDKEQNELE
jgi:hypothetical protein